jgi:hypothetical protein
MVAVRTSERLVYVYETSCHHIPESSRLHNKFYYNKTYCEDIDIDNYQHTELIFLFGEH